MKRVLTGLLLALFSVAGWAGAGLPKPERVVIVVEENRAYSQIVGNPSAPWINGLAGRGALFTRSFGVTHPSQPNYLALFSGTTRGIGSNACPLVLGGANLASALFDKGYGFASYSESMPGPGFDGCIYGAYRRKHNPVANWAELARYNLTFKEFPVDFKALPTVSLVVPDQLNDMHDGSIARGDAWLAANIEPYVQWAMAHNSLLIVTWDEDDGSEDNRVPTLFIGPMVKPGRYAQRIDHYTVLKTVCDMYGLDCPGEAANARPVSGIWNEAGR